MAAGGGEGTDRTGKVTGRMTLHNHFQTQTKVEHEQATKVAFRLHKRQMRRRRRQVERGQQQNRAGQHRQDRTTTLNVRGLATSLQKLGTKLQGLKEQHTRGNRDVIYIQETHLNPVEHDAAAAQHVAMWGFNYTTADQYSLWSSGNDRRAGVAILVNPYGAVRNLKGWREDKWSEHLIMATGELAGRKMLFINVYAPVNGAVRVQFYRRLNQLEIPDDIDIVCGGDFNCVSNNGLDRIGGEHRAELGASDLANFIARNGLYDAGYYNMPAVNGGAALRKYATTHHTHFHKAGSGKKGSSRLDRFYVGARARHLVRGIETEEALCRSDHRAVLLELHSPRGAIRVRKRPKLYPPPAYVQAATHSLITQELQELNKRLEKDAPADTPRRWEEFKVTTKEKMKKLKQEARCRMTNGMRQRIKRLKVQLKKCSGDEHTGESNRADLLTALNLAQETRRTLKRRVLVSNNAWSARATTKQFFRRVCNKFGDNTIPKLVPTTNRLERQEHDKANILADSWAEVFNGEADDKDSIEDFIARYSGNWNREDMSDLDAEITEQEVEAAITRCKAGKACGPDAFGNEWYTDHKQLLVPALTRIFNDCLNLGLTPSSFLDAYIFSISKGGDTSSPMNYRPISLLNTDYKIFTRILAWRVRRYIAKLVNHRQCGFVPGRTIHEVIDMFEAAKEICRNNSELSDAQVLLLDFAKAYDSLDRDFLMAVLKAKGLPPKICKIIKSIHDKTSVQFMANGFLSEKMQVTSGIRQGCPLAPLLFVIAVDVLYDVITNESGLQGIPLGGELETAPLQVAGYADDTAIYILNKNMQATAIGAVKRFSAVSGLKLNVKKSAAINLGQDQAEVAASNTDEQANPKEVHINGAVEQEDGSSVDETNSTRYLGHIAGSGDTVDEAWEKAMAALRVRLVLAEVKTNTVQQRAAIANAIILPKLMFVARHAWPTQELIKKADLSIRNYVWKSKFAVAERAPAGWVQAGLAEQPPGCGGLGVPNIRTELMAMSATVVGDWALTQDKQKQRLGEILQTRDTGTAEPVVPQQSTKAEGPLDTLWATGRPWAEQHFNNITHLGGDSKTDIAELRAALRHANGVNTRWTNGGLIITCGGRGRQMLGKRRTRHLKERGVFLHKSVLNVKLKHVWVGDSQGKERKWVDFKHMYPNLADMVVGNIMDIETTVNGGVVFTPITHTLPLTSKEAHSFREVSLSILANYPELVFRRIEDNMVHIQHGLEDKHHMFSVTGEIQGHLEHTWGSTTSPVPWDQAASTMEEAIARFLKVPPSRIRCTPHKWLTKMRPMWAGKRRWSQSRKQYKKLMNKKRDNKAEAAKQRIQRQLAAGHERVAQALETVTWRQIQRMESVTAYQTQTLMKLKLDRLRLWAGEERGYKCVAASCATEDSVGTMHMAWTCAESQEFWGVLLAGWEGG